MKQPALVERFRYRRLGNDYILAAPFEWEVGYAGSGLLLTIPAGFLFQSSVPRFARWIVSPHHRWWLLAACVHDFILSIGHPQALASAEWLTAARALHTDDDPDPKKRLVLPAYLGICIVTVR